MGLRPSEDLDNVVTHGEGKDHEGDILITRTVSVNWFDGNSVILKWWHKLFPPKNEEGVK